MYVTVLYVKCKTRKCGETISVGRSFASGETRNLQCRIGHTNTYGESSVKHRTAKIMERSILKFRS